jgi:hypothetical protein
MYTWESSLAATIYLPFAVREAEIWLLAFRKPAQNLHQFDQQENKYIPTKDMFPFVQICRCRGILHPSRQNMKTVVRHHLSSFR